MARNTDDEYSYLNRRQIAASIGTDPAAIAAFESLQTAAFENGPAASAEAQATADAAGQAASGAQQTADKGVSDAATAQGAADTAQDRADAAYDLADGKVAKNVGPAWVAPAAAPSRAAVPAYTGGNAAATYDAAEVTALKGQVAALTAALAALVIDGRANRSLTN